MIYAKGVWLADEERGWVGQVHRWTNVALGYGLHPREGSIVRGMVLGDSSRIPGELEDAFRRSGITQEAGIHRVPYRFGPDDYRDIDKGLPVVRLSETCL